jgi:predicted TPR repeat methyltransferase
MVANDPLYLVTNDIHHLKEITSVYSDVYQKRLRVYEIHNQNFSTLPHAQFGFILCWDFLNYLPIDVIKWYLESVMALLRPGGVFMFSYNNADIETSARLVDQKRACWATDSVIKKLATDAGFEIINFSDLAINDNENTWVSWAEIKKTGELRTVKVSQAMGQVLSK